MRITDLFEGASKNAFRKYGGTIMPFSKLPASAQKSLHNYLSEYAEDDQYTRSKFGYVMLPAEVLKKLCWNAPDNDFEGDHASWDDYAEWYWSAEDDANYTDHMKEMWPVILDDGEGILDGWHRMHWYLRQGVDRIPAILFV